MPNHLIHAASPYLLQHAENPVDWYPWGSAALELARRQDKPIFLSIGYAACHWCHVMAHESFEDPAIATFMNEHFVNIKVDREERPDLDGIYMQAVVALTGQGGWPMSVFLMPDGTPFYGGTYFPPMRRYNMPSFIEVLQALAHAWETDRQNVEDAGRNILVHLRAQAGGLAGARHALSLQDTLESALSALASSYDWTHGGWGRAPKFPQPMGLELLLRIADRSLGAFDGNAAPASSTPSPLGMVVHALDAMARGGMYDVVGGGFARYATDDRWLVPHFEKMLYDNAQLARVYLHAWQVTGQARYRRVCEETLDFVLREMTHPLGGFYSSLDADSEGEEGKFYVWTLDEIREVLADPKDVAFFLTAYAVTEKGNFEGKTVLQRALGDQALAGQFGMETADVPERLHGLHARLLAARSQRIRPGTDDKVLVSWNALMLATFAEAFRYLGRPDYLAAARRNAGFILENMTVDGRLYRAWRTPSTQYGLHSGDGRGGGAFLEDYAALILGLLALYQSDGDAAWYAHALRLAEEMVAHFTDPAGGFYDTRDDAETLILRPKDLQDNATPSGSALAACALLQLVAYEGRGDWRDRAEAMLASVQEAMSRYPTAFAQWLQALDFALGPVHEVAIIGEADDPRTQALLQGVWERFHPRLVAAIASYPAPQGSPALLDDRPLVGGQPTAYVCQGFVCRQPVNTAEDLEAQLQENDP